MSTESPYFKPHSLWTWYLLRRVEQDLCTHPFKTMLLFTAVATTVALIGILLLLDRTLSATYTRLMNQAPDMVIRKIGSGGWAPMETQNTLRTLSTIPGVLNPRFRVWGVVRSGQAPVTVVGLQKTKAADWPFNLPRPGRGEALVGPGVDAKSGGSHQSRIVLYGRKKAALKVIGQLPRRAAMAVHDVVVTHVSDARRLLGLSTYQASDLVLNVFHSDEAEALRPDLAQAFAFPVEIVTRKESRVRALNDISRRTSWGLLTCMPALLALAWVVVAAGSRIAWERGETGLLKALGWTGADILRLHLVRSVWIALPAVVTGAAGAYLLLFSPGVTWISHLILGWNDPAPALYLSINGIFFSLSLAVLIVFLPFLAAVYWSGWQLAKSDPADFLETRQG